MLDTRLQDNGESISPEDTSRSLTVYQTALLASKAGISVVPIAPDGTKCPSCQWKAYQHRRASLHELNHWFLHSPNGIALIMGAISGGLETLDFDTHEIYHQWSERMEQQGQELLHQRLIQGYVEASPNGVHLLYRCAFIEGNQKLAKVPIEGPQRYKTLIETRGEGGLVIVAPSHGGVHPSGKPYVLLCGGVSTIQMISASERQQLFAIARTFDQTPPPEPFLPKRPPSHVSVSDLRPGDRYNQQATWQDVLEPHGWKLLFVNDEQGYWQRPGKEGPGVSATTNYAGSDLLYVFSTSTVFEAGHGYSKFAAYTFLEHGGDFSAAARTLVKMGYAE